MKSKNDSSKVVSIQDLQNEVNFKETVKFNADLMKANEALTEKLLIAEEKIKHLENLLTKHVPILGNPDIFLKPKEEHIVEKQLEMMLEQALTRPMTLDEVKKFDLLIKNKRLLTAREDDTRDVLPIELSEEQLQAMASQKLAIDYVKPKDDE